MVTFSDEDQKSLVRGTGQSLQDMLAGPVNFYIKTMTVGSTENYTTGGFTLNPSSRFMTIIDAEGVGAKGYKWRYNKTSKKVEAWSGVTQVANNNTGVRSDVVRLKVFEARA